jgi:hypothetical protein
MTPRSLLSSPSSPEIPLPRRVLSFKIFLCCGAYYLQRCPPVFAGEPGFQISGFLPSWWSCCPDCRFHFMVVGLIVTTYRLLSHQASPLSLVLDSPCCRTSAPLWFDCCLPLLHQVVQPAHSPHPFVQLFSAKSS